MFQSSSVQCTRVNFKCVYFILHVTQHFHLGSGTGWRIYMVYHMMYIHGIYTVIHGYSWICLASGTRFSGRPVLLVSFNAHTCVDDQEYFIPLATMAIVPGRKAVHNRLSPTAANLEHSPLCRWWRLWLQRRLLCRGSLSVFLVLLRAPTWILVKDGADGAFRAGDQCVEQLRRLSALKIEKNKFLFAKVVDHVLTWKIGLNVQCN